MSCIDTVVQLQPPPTQARRHIHIIHFSTLQVPQNPVQAAARRDAVAKSLYERLFDLIVSRINVALDPEKQAGAAGEQEVELLSIGVLDIYGFEGE